MAERIETVSFDLDTRAAVASVDKCIVELNKLDKELQQLQKEGKDTAAVQRQIAATTSQMNKALQQTTTTTKGATAQIIALGNAERKLEGQSKALSTAQQKNATSFARSISSSKNLTSALARGAAGIANFAGGFGIAAGAVSLVADKLVAFVGTLFEASQAEKSLDNVTKAYTETIAKETGQLQVNVEVLKDSNKSLSDRQAALKTLTEQFPQYFGALSLEKSTLEQINFAYEQSADLIRRRAIQQALSDERTALASKRVQIELEREQRIQKSLTAARERGQSAESIKKLEFNLRANSVSAAEYLDKILEIDAAQKVLDQTEASLLEKRRAAFSILDASGKALANAGDETKKTTEEAKKNAEATRKQAAEAKALKGSLADLEAQLFKVNKELTDNTNVADAQTIFELGQEYQRLSAEIAKARAEIERATKAQSVDLAARLGGVKAQLKTVEDTQEAQLRALKQSTEQLELQKQLDLNRIEAERQRNLKATNNAKAEQIINAAAAKQRADVEKRADVEILQSRIAVQEKLREIAVSNKEETTGIDLELANLRAALLKLTENEYTVKIDVDENSRKKTIEKLKQVVKQVADTVEAFSGQVFDFLQSRNEQAIQTADNAIARQKEVLNALLSNEQQTNAEQVRLEQERLDKLNAEREKAKEREARIAQAQIAINLALAVARAVAEGGGVASAITVGLAISAAVFGFLKAKQASEQAFFDGTLYAKRGKGEPRGRDTIKARINEGEAVIPTATNKKYHPAIEAIYNGTVPADAINSFVENYGRSISDADELRRQNAGFSAGAFDILQLAAALRAPAISPEKREDNQEIKTALELLIAEFRRGRDSGDGKRRSAPDVRGKIRARLGVKKTGGK